MIEVQIIVPANTLWDRKGAIFSTLPRPDILYTVVDSKLGDNTLFAVGKVIVGKAQNPEAAKPYYNEPLPVPVEDKVIWHTNAGDAIKYLGEELTWDWIKQTNNLPDSPTDLKRVIP